MYYNNVLNVIDTTSYGAPGVNVGVSGSIVPLSNNTYSLGTTGYVWSELYVGTGSVHIGEVNLSSTPASAPFTGTTGPSLIINSNFVPDIPNFYTLGASGSSWREMFVGPGSINIEGPPGATNVATIGSDLSGIVYTQYGFATPFINVGPAIGTDQAVGGWQIFGTGVTGLNGTLIPTNLYVQANTPSGPTGPLYSLISGTTGATGPTGPQGFTGQQGPTGTVGIILTATGFSGFSGPAYGGGAINTGGTAYFLDGSNLRVTTKNYQTNIINASFQTYVPITSGVNNLSATIMRSFVGMTGYNIPNTEPALNLANRVYVTGPFNSETTGDVQYPSDRDNSSYITYLNTSLWTISTEPAIGNPHIVNAFTVNMQAIDTVTNLSGPTGLYYAVRVSTDANSPNYSTIRLSSIQTG